jgi:hypothetical protein
MLQQEEKLWWQDKGNIKNEELGMEIGEKTT